MTTKHTPGPWVHRNLPGAGLSIFANTQKQLGERYSNDYPIFHVSNDACGLQIAYELWTQFPKADWDAMQEANARIMAAAPDLLEALKLAVDEIAVCTDEEARWKNAAVAAIAKATGDQP